MKSITIKFELDPTYWSDEDYAGDKSGQLLMEDLVDCDFGCGVNQMTVVSTEEGDE